MRHIWLSLLLLGIPNIGLAKPSSVPPDKTSYIPGKGLHHESDDGRFSTNMRLRAQFLWTGNIPEEGDNTQGMQIRRARLAFTGHMFSPKTKFKAEFAVSPKDLGFTGDNPINNKKEVHPSRSPLLDWYVQFNQLRDLSLRIGQYKVPFSRQRVISSGNLQFVDRSIVNSEFTVDRDVGLDFRSANLFGLDRLKYYAGVYMGEGHSSYGEGDFGLMYLGRLEYLPFGMFKDYKEVDHKRKNAPRLSLAIGYAFVDDAKGNKGILGKFPSDGGTTDTHHLTADLLFKYSGLSVQSEFHYRNGSRNPGTESDEMELPRNGWGIFNQVGYVLPSTDIEVAGRHAVIRTSDNSSLKDKNELGTAISYYPGGHPYKLQADYFQVWQDDMSQADHRIRVQLQVSY